jgi:hypothetical protein
MRQMAADRRVRMQEQEQAGKKRKCGIASSGCVNRGCGKWVTFSSDGVFGNHSRQRAQYGNPNERPRPIYATTMKNPYHMQDIHGIFFQ